LSAGPGLAIFSANEYDEGNSMNRIKVLAEEVANRIAAGEVVERPASVVKELVENALDAGASQITVTVENGGNDSVSISDNGCGMNADDALTAFERHATSKIRSVSDIFHIDTLGFRGEALPAIASASRLTLVTRESSADLATQIDFDGGRLMEVTKTAANPGTTVTVRRLFHNIPARRKFLRSAQVEYKHILDYIHYQVLLYPHVQFKLVADGKLRLNYPAVETLHQRLIEVFGADFTGREMLPVDNEAGDQRITGYIQSGEDVREGVQEYRYLFINGRYIRDKIVIHSIRQACDPFMKKLRAGKADSLPSFILFLRVAPELVDVNVHPAKNEVRFRDAQRLHGFVKDSLTSVLLQHEESMLSELRRQFPTEVQSPGEENVAEPAPLPRDTRVPGYIPPAYAEKGGYTPPSYTPPPKQVPLTRKQMESLYQPVIFPELAKVEPIASSLTPVQDDLLKMLKPEEEFINPWQLHQSYILFQTEEGLIMLDQHAAHERILYEKLLHRIHGAPPITQRLVFPMIVDLPPILAERLQALMTDNAEVFNRVGFSIKTMSGNSVAIDEVPSELGALDGGEVFTDILRQLQTELAETQDFRDGLAKSVACKAAIKAGKKLGPKEMIALVNDLFACQVPYFCPHGRPVLFRMSLTEIEKRFRRIE
jgi:DNA mismatch repair protein MutL